MQRRSSLGARQHGTFGAQSPPPPPPPPPLTHIGGSTPKTFSGSGRRVKYSSDDSVGESPGGFNNNIPRSFSCSDDDYELPGSRRPRRSSYRNGTSGRAKKSRYWMVSCGIFMAIIFVAAYLLVPHYKRVVLDQHLIEQDKILREKEMDLSIRFDSKIAELQKENKELHKKAVNEKELIILNQQLKDEKNRMEFQMKDVGGGAHSKELQQKYEVQIEKLSRHNVQLTTYKKKMQENIQLMSRTALIERYGLGPHFVEMVVQFDSHQGRNDQGLITVELASVEDMPHAVYWFLEQVRRKLYDGCSFHRNAAHVVQAGPASNFLSPPNPQLSKRFKDAGFDKILFQEYSPNSPHVRFSLGYSGRPGGPDFYISMQDNSRIHGPGGQDTFEDSGEADTCFAKVVGGFDIVERIHKSPVKKGDYHAMESNIAIVSMTIQKKKMVNNIKNK
jgi:cyclophilin family peptidyl-prolyl cis-trans isomerase